MFGFGKNKDEVKKVRSLKQKEKKEEMNFVGRYVPKKGCTIYEVNLETFEYTPVEYVQQDFVIGEKAPRKRINMKKGYTYISALNEKNIKRKIAKLKAFNNQLVNNQ